MKTKVKRLSKRTLALFLGVLMLITSIGVGTLFTVNAANGTVTNKTVYFTPYHGNEGAGWIKDNKTIGARYLYGDNFWQSATGSDTGRTKDGQRVYSVTVQEKYGGMDHLYFRNDKLEDSNSNEQHAINGWSTTDNWSGKYYNGSSWNTLSYDTFSVRNNGSALTDLTFNSTTKKYTGSATLNAGTTYKLNIYDGGRYWANSGAGTLTNTGSATMYRYGSGGSGDGFSITPEVTGTYSFEWSLAGAGNREDTGTFKVTYPTIYTVSYTLGSNVSYSSVSGGTKTANGTIKAVSGSNVALTVSYANNYEYDSSNSTLNGAVVSNSNKTFTFSSISSNKSITINAKSSNTPLSAPTIKYNSSTSTPVNIDASKGSKARITWAEVANASSYEVFKDDVSQGTTTNLYYDIERGYSYGGTYTVKAIPNTASYSTSDASNGIAFTFNRVALTAPTVNPDKSTILHNEKVTFTISGGATSGTLGTDYRYQRTAANGSSYSNVTGSSWTSGALANTTTADVSDVFKFRTQAISTDYYTDSSATSKTITVKPAFGVDSGSTSTFEPGTATAMSYDSTKAAYYLNVTLTSTSNYYFRINQMGANPKWSGSWNGDYPSVYDVVVDGAKVAADNDVSGWGSKASLHYNGSAKKIIIWFDYANKKVWIEGNSTKYSVTITQPSATGSSIKVADATTSPQQFFDGDTVNYSVTAGTGNVITGVTINGNTTSVDRKTSYTGSFDISQNTTITATVVKQYSITKNDATGGSYTVKRGSTAVTKFIAGDSLTLTPSPSDHYDFTNFAVSGGKTATLTANPSTLDTTGATGNITITPTWTPKTYTTLTAVGKYSTDGTTYSTAMSTAPTIAATSGTYQTGVKVTAPDVSGFKFVEWYTDKGTFGNASDKETMFKPNANGAQAVARYKKIFTITSSVDSSGKGAGTVTTDKTSVEAGGSYTITANAANGSAIESVMVGNTNKGTNASTTISNVSADQEVKVKFKSNITIRGGSTIGTNWDPGDQMTSNAAGTEFTKAYTNVAGSSSGTSYEFKLHNGTSYSDDSSATVTITGGASTGTMTTKAAAGVNWKLTLKQAANVTIKSDGTKITEIKVVPVNTTKHTVTFKKAANTTITGQYEGVNFSTASADAVVQVYDGDEISFTVTPADGYYISSLTGATFTPEFSSTVSNYKISNVTADKTITPTAASKLSVKAVTNKSARGTVTVNKSTAAPGESITITVSPKNGVLKSLTCTYANGAVYTCNISTKAWTKTTNATNAQAQRSVDGMAAFAFRDKVSKLMTSATAKLFSGADTSYTMTLAENSAATINATFDAYSGESTWYYNGYDTSGNAVSGYHTKQMTEGMVSGEKFSYYHVEGRTGADQLMTVSDGVPSSGTRYVYFVRPTDWGTGWSASNNPRAHFWNDTTSQTTWPGTEMTWAWNNDYGQGVYKTAIPADAKYVKFNDNNGKQTVYIDLTTTGGAYYLAGGGSGTNDDGYHIAEWNTGWADQGWVASGTEYFYQNSTHNGDYTGDFNTKGFYNHNTASKLFAKPKELGSNTGDYYINVLYPNTTYTINGVTKKTGTNPMIIWSAEPLAGDDETTTIYAKDGAIRSETSGATYANIADTKIYSADGTTTVGTKHNGSITNQTYETYKASKGDTIVIKTQIGATDSGTLSNAADLKAKYYVRGFCVNGEVSELLEWKADGLYTLTYKVPEDEDLSKIEITPIYYLNDTEHNPIVTYRVTGFTDELKAVGSGKPNWGDTLYTYPFYGTLGGQNNAFGAYPGQPMVYYKGQYQMQIPQKDTAWDPYAGTDATTLANTSVSGITMSNGYYDLVHRQIMGYGDDSTSADHVQTYDYGDFYKIFNEKKPVDNIVFDFKYKTKKHNLTDIITSKTTASALTSKYGDTNGNGFEPLTNFHGRAVDLFGTPLSGDAADTSKTKPLYVVSMGGVDGSKGVENIAGYYATEWNVYAPSTKSGTPANSDVYSRVSGGDKTSIPPEVLVLNDDDNTSFNTTTYPSAVAEGTGAYNYQVTDWKTLYHSLESYRGIPVLISYEKASMQVGEKNHTTSGSGGATRNDGRWLYSKNGENITGKIKIQYSNDTGETYVDNPASGETGYVDGLSAYFTNDGVEGQMTFATTIDPDKTFDFEAKTTNANYKFVGWYMEDGTKITTDNASLTERSGSYTFVAKFMQVTTGQLILSHSVDTNATYKGAGTAKIGVVVKNGDDEVVRTYDLSTSDITLDDKIIKSDNSDYTIEVTLEATATGNDTYETTVLANPSGQEAKFYKNPSTTTVDKTNTIVLDSFTVGDLFTNGTTQNVKNIIYHSYFNEAVFNYNFKFTFKDRFGNDKTYYRIGKLTSAQASNTDYVETSGTTKYLKPAFYSKLAPHESNFGKNFSWGDMSANKPFTNSGNVWTCEATITSTQTDNNARTATFKLPYAHTNGVPSNLSIMDKATSVNYVMNNITYGSVVKKDVEDYITAPRQLNDNGTIKNFQYWSVVSTSNTEKEVARCYYYSFNFVAYDNYEITPVYDTGATPLTNGNGDTPLTTISYLSTTRNQYTGNGTDTAPVNANARDVLFNDFVLSYEYNGLEIFKNDDTSSAVTDLGYVVERVQKLEIQQDGSPYVDPAHYSAKSISVKTDDEIKNFIKSGSVKSGTLTKHQILKDSLDNKNRIEFAETYDNSIGWNSETQKPAKTSGFKNYVYKAYTYMIVNGEVTLSDPAYFTMYDEAKK